MSEFINTIDVLGDDAVIDSIIDRTITEFNDNVITNLGASAFQGCTALRSVNLPNVSTAGVGVFRECSALERVELGANAIPETAFAHCASFREGIFPRATTVGSQAFWNCLNIQLLDFHFLTSINGGDMYNWIKHFVIRTPMVCSLAGTGNLNARTLFYVPSALLDSYKSATNWSSFADNIRPLESFTVDGTVDGEICIHNAYYSLLRGVSSSNMDVYVGHTYRTTLTPNTDNPVTDVVITMGDIDVTSSVYNPVTREVVIEHVTGDISISAAIAVENATIVKSLNSDGASCIMTDFIPDDSTVFTFVGYDESIDNSYESYFNVKGSYGFRAQIGSGVLLIGSAQFGITTPDTRTIQIDLVNDTVSYNGVAYSHKITVDGTNPLVLFSMMNANGSLNSPGRFKLYSASATQNGVLTHEWLPARDSSGRACLYDSVQNKFLYNSGTGTFTCDV